MLIDIPDATPLKHIFDFALSQNCRLKSNSKGGFDFVPEKNLFNINVVKK